jgi:hypothetical protein
MGQLFVINAPQTFAAIWLIAKQWLSKETADKVQILGNDYREALLELIDAENLPSILGGTCECKEHGGCHRGMAGPWMEGRVGWGKNTPPSISPEKIKENMEKEAAEKRRKEEAEKKRKEDSERRKREAAEKREKEKQEKRENEAAEKEREKGTMTPKKEVSEEKAAVLGEQKEPTKSLESDRWEVVSTEQDPLRAAAKALDAQVLVTGHVDEAQAAALAAQIIATETPEPTTPTSTTSKELATPNTEATSNQLNGIHKEEAVAAAAPALSAEPQKSTSEEPAPGAAISKVNGVHEAVPDAQKPSFERQLSATKVAAPAAINPPASNEA